MSRISQDLDYINKGSCFFCETEALKGGFWLGLSDIYVCKNCAKKLLHLAIDTLLDTEWEDKGIVQQYESWQELTERVFWEKQALRIGG